MIDYFCRWTSEAAAKQDAMRLRNYFGSDGATVIKDWYLHQFLPDVKAWRPSQDTGVYPNLVHTYLTGWFGILALDHIEDVIINDNSIAFALAREGPPYIIKNNIGSIITDVAVEPIFSGSHYPLGGFS
jgi:hypothetical protein